MMRLDEDGPSALVQTPEPVNKFPDLVAHLVRRLKVLCPAMGTARIAAVLSRAGLHLGRTTVRRMLKHRPRRIAPAATVRNERRIRSSRPNHIWLVDLTTVPTLAGFWIPGCPGRSPSAGRSAAGSPSVSTTSLVESWASALPRPAQRQGDQRIPRRHDPRRRAGATAPDHGPREVSSRRGRSGVAAVAPGSGNASARSGSTAASRSSSAASGRSRRKACGAGLRRSGGAPSGGSWRSSLTGTTVNARMPGWRVRRPTRSTSGGCRLIIGRALNPARDGRAPRLAPGHKRRSAADPACGSISTFVSWTVERTFPSSR